MERFKLSLNFLLYIFQDYSVRATDLDLQVEKLSKEKKDYVEEIKVSFYFIL